MEIQGLWLLLGCVDWFFFSPPPRLWVIGNYVIKFPFWLKYFFFSFSAYVRAAGCSAPALYPPKLLTECSGQRGADQVLRAM